MSISDLLIQRAPRSARKDSPVVLRHMGRRDLPEFVRSLHYTSGAEIGVWKGAFSEAFCVANPDLHMLCVDPWKSYPAWRDAKNGWPPDVQERNLLEAYTLATTRLSSRKATIARAFSVEAAAAVPDRSLNFAYIDANHVYDAVIEDLIAWTPKVKPGGFIAGHDFRVFPNKPTIEVVAAVTDYTQAHGIKPWFVLAAEKTPSFLWEVH